MKIYRKIKARLHHKFNNLFWDLDVIKAAERRVVQDSRRDMVYWITNRIDIDKTIEFLQNEKKNDKKYWNLACFIDKNLHDPRI